MDLTECCKEVMEFSQAFKPRTDLEAIVIRYLVEVAQGRRTHNPRSYDAYFDPVLRRGYRDDDIVRVMDHLIDLVKAYFAEEIREAEELEGRARTPERRSEQLLDICSGCGILHAGRCLTPERRPKTPVRLPIP
jgi:hypothetical protein